MASCYYCALTSIALRNSFLGDNKASAVGLIFCTQKSTHTGVLRSISVPLCVRKFIQCRGFLSVSLLLVLYCVSMGARHIKEHISKPKADQWESVFSAKKEKKKLKASLQRPSVYSRVLLGQPNSTPGQLDFWKTPCWKWQIETKT